jgi:hypothetical protein
MMRDDVISKLEAALAGPEPQRVYALYVDRTAVVLFAARTLSEARQISRETWLLDELRSAKLNGQPLVGVSDKVWVVRANREQERLYESTLHGKPPADDISLVYLVPLEGIAASDDAA